MIIGIVASGLGGPPPPDLSRQIVWARAGGNGGFIRPVANGGYLPADTFSITSSLDGGVFTKHPTDPNLIAASTGSGFQFYRRSGTIWSPVAMTGINRSNVNDYKWSPDGKAFVIARSTSPWFILYSVDGDTYTHKTSGLNLLSSSQRAIAWRNNQQFTMIGGSPRLGLYEWDGDVTVTQVTSSQLADVTSMNMAWWSSTGTQLIGSANGTRPWIVLNLSGTTFSNANVSTPGGSTGDQTFMSQPKRYNAGDVYGDYFVMRKMNSTVYVVRRSGSSWSYQTVPEATNPTGQLSWDNSGQFFALSKTDAPYYHYFQKVDEEYVSVRPSTSPILTVSTMCIL